MCRQKLLWKILNAWLLLVLYVSCSLIERGKYAEGWEALREIRGPFYEDTYSEFMSIVRAAAAAPKVSYQEIK
jgi:hypothetical protein